jgi:hypothetical protein
MMARAFPASSKPNLMRFIQLRAVLGGAVMLFKRRHVASKGMITQVSNSWEILWHVCNGQIPLLSPTRNVMILLGVVEVSREAGREWLGVLFHVKWLMTLLF